MRRLTRTLTKTSCKAKTPLTPCWARCTRMFPSHSSKNPFLRKIRTVRTITTRRAKPNIGTMTATKPRCTSNRTAPAKATIWRGMVRKMMPHLTVVPTTVQTVRGMVSSRLTKQLPAVPPNTTTALAPSCNLTLRLQRTARLL